MQPFCPLHSNRCCWLNIVFQLESFPIKSMTHRKNAIRILLLFFTFGHVILLHEWMGNGKYSRVESKTYIPFYADIYSLDTKYCNVRFDDARRSVEFMLNINTSHTSQYTTSNRHFPTEARLLCAHMHYRKSRNELNKIIKLEEKKWSNELGWVRAASRHGTISDNGHSAVCIEQTTTMFVCVSWKAHTADRAC